MSIEFLLILGVVLILTLVGVVFIIPSDKKGSRKKRKLQEDLAQKNKVLEQKILRMEKHIKSLRDEALTLEKIAKVNEKALVTEKVKVKKFQEKLTQERAWHKKEQNTLDKKGKEFQGLKEELKKVQESASGEHAHNIRLEREIKILNEQNDSLNDQRREAEGENAQLKAKADNSRREIAHLKKDVAELSKKKDDIQWIAKSEYDRVAQLLKEKEKKLQRLERELDR